MIKAVIFDMDGVIIDSEGVYLQYQLEFAKKKNPDVKLEVSNGGSNETGMLGGSGTGSFQWTNLGRVKNRIPPEGYLW